MALVNYKGKNIFTINAKGIEPVRLLPGINEIPDKYMPAIKAHPFYNSFVKDGMFEILSETKDNDGKRSVEDMLKFIPNMVDSRLLKKIISEDGRDVVTRAAQDQLDLIKGTKKKVEENEHFQ
jgi:hypothetical protein